MSTNGGTDIASRWSRDGMRFLGTFVVLLLAGVIAYVTFLGLINSQMDSASNAPANVNAPIIDYGG